MALAGCSAGRTPDNLEPVSDGGGYQAQYRSPDATRRDADALRSASINRQRCLPPAGGSGSMGLAFAPAALAGERLSPNDLLDVRVSDDEVFKGAYVVSRDGNLRLPFLRPIPAQGRSAEDVEADLARQLVKEQFYDARPRLSVRLTDLAGISVAVSGAVFQAGVVQIGGQPGDQIDGLRQRALGASTEARNLSAALSASGGIRPDADLSAVALFRQGQKYVLDMRGVFEGQNAVDVMLLTGDEIVVPSRQCFQEQLMRPSPVSPPGVRLFLSNLTQPATGNAPSAIGREGREMPYGTRYLQAVVDTNCVGGARATSASRSAVLFSRNPVTQVSVVIERDIENLLRRADRDDYDPYLLPGDSIACYDSAVTNLTEIGRVLGIVGAAVLLAH